MQQKIVPTSPKSPFRKLEVHSTSHSFFGRHEHLWMLVLAIVCGATSGFFGVMIAWSVPVSWPIIGKFNIIAFMENQRQSLLLSIRGREQSLIRSQSGIINEIAALYSEEPTLEHTGTFLGNAAIVTRDGWMVVPHTIWNQNNTEKQSMTVILPDGSVRQPDQYVIDPLTNTVFFHVSATNLSTVTFTKATRITTGELLSILEKRLEGFIIQERRVAGEVFGIGGTLSTSKANIVMMIDKGSELHQGVPVFAADASFVGFLQEGGIVVHSAYLTGALANLLSTSTITRSDLDIEYANVAVLTEPERLSRNLPDYGIVIVRGMEQTNDIDPKTIIITNDLIRSINYEPIDDKTDLSILIHNRYHGDVLTLDILRQNVPLTITLTL